MRKVRRGKWGKESGVEKSGAEKSGTRKMGREKWGEKSRVRKV